MKQTPIDDKYMTKLYVGVYEGYLLLGGKTMKDYLEKNINYLWQELYTNYHLFYCSKTFYNTYHKHKIEKGKENELIENIKKYPVILEFVNNILKEDSIFMEVQNE